MVRDVTQLIRGDAVKRRIQIRTQLDGKAPPIRADRAQLEQVLLNLAMNGMDAMEHHGRGARELKLDTSWSGDGMVEVTVRDCGQGIAPEHMPLLFESFFTTRKEGMGLGLCVAKSIIVTHGGSIWAENNEGGGAIFHFTVPVAESFPPLNLLQSLGTRGRTMVHKSRVAIAVLLGCCLFACCMAPSSFAQPAAPSQMDRDLMEITVPQLQKLYADRKYTVTQVVGWYLARIHRYDGVYKAVETRMAKQALADAAREDSDKGGGHGPLWGAPIVIKANTSIAGQITTDGWAGFTMQGHQLIAPKDAPVVAKLKAAGAIIIGHTNMPDFANSDESRSSSFGRTGDAYDVRFSPGGSSSGTVTSVSANMALLGTGTDTANSIRMPVATSALVGVFPTRGLVPIAGIAPLDWMLDNTGPIARDVTEPPSRCR